MTYDDWKQETPPEGDDRWIHVDQQRPGNKSVVWVQYEGAVIKAEYRREKFWDYMEPDKMLDVELCNIYNIYYIYNKKVLHLHYQIKI